MQSGNRQIYLFERWQYLCQQGIAGLGNYYPLTHAVEQPHTQFLLQLLDLVGQGGLGDMSSISSPSEMQCFSQSSEISEVTEFHIEPTSDAIDCFYIN
jgi:hypothetical protein